MSAVPQRAFFSAPAIAVGVPSESDVPALIALINALAAERSQLFIQPVDRIGGMALLREHLSSIAANHNEIVFVAREGDVLVGLITGIRGTHPARRGAIEIGIGVLRSHRSRGIGTALLAALEAWARAAGCHRLSLQVAITNAPAIALYRKAGFAIEGKLDATAILNGTPVDELAMAKLLEA